MKIKRTLPIMASYDGMIVVSNRLPFVLKRNDQGQLERKASPGGLVTAVAPVVIQGEGFWIGWPGIHLTDTTEPIPESDPSDITPTAGLKSEKVPAMRAQRGRRQIIPVYMDPQVFDSYYNGCCNETFWPLFHSMPDRTVFEKQHWLDYQYANRIFADRTMEAVTYLAKNTNHIPLVWIHDYHLMVAANWIRQAVEKEKLTCNLAFFLHIPFPSWDIFCLLPWSDQILRGILCCDLVGFHITGYCLNFIDCCQRSLDCRVDRKNLSIDFDGRVIKVCPLPIGIPYNKFVELAESAPRVLTNDQKIILGVDRMDYTKGLIHRFLAFEKLLSNYPEHLKTVCLLQICVPSRIDVKEYQDLKEQIDQLVGRINGTFSTLDWSPIKYIYGSVRQDELAAIYRDSFVGLVTPLRDGMNLVAKEFVACQINVPPGVLIISPFAGAGVTMNEALICNPYELDGVSEIINKALTMPEDERKVRMNCLRKRESLNDINNWFRSFLKAVNLVSQKEASVEVCEAHCSSKSN